jgi:methylmalonyl-CoA/ethylmalonyl-CoA epimerase|tara:strand:- start:116756 stop:117172 length:417 start_codon:yes stop_codon:yes gene_type:complete
MVRGTINHVGIATHSLEASEQIWSALGFSPDSDYELPEQGVRVRYMTGAGETRIELLEPLSDDTPIGRFLTRKGPGVQQVAINVQDIDAKISELKEMGMTMINDIPIYGSGGHRIAFVHPSSCGGVLVELVENPQSES